MKKYLKLRYISFLILTIKWLNKKCIFRKMTLYRIEQERILHKINVVYCVIPIYIMYKLESTIKDANY